MGDPDEESPDMVSGESLGSDNVPYRNKCLQTGEATPDFCIIFVRLLSPGTNIVIGVSRDKIC